MERSLEEEEVVARLAIGASQCSWQNLDAVFRVPDTTFPCLLAVCSWFHCCLLLSTHQLAVFLRALRPIFSFYVIFSELTSSYETPVTIYILMILDPFGMPPEIQLDTEVKFTEKSQSSSAECV